MKLTSLTQITLGLLLTFAFIGNEAKANLTSIQGSITFNGIASTNTGTLSGATSFSSISGVTVVPTVTGNYVGLVGDPVTFTPFSFSASSVTPLWTFTVGAITYSFTATSVNIINQTGTFLNLAGTGVASETGFADTIGNWSITDTGSGDPSFSFGAGSNVPDSGTTAMLIVLGLGAIGLGLFAQKKKSIVA